MNKTNWKKLCGYEPSKEQKEYILAMVRDEGITIEEACSRMALPPMFIEGVNKPDPEVYDNDFRPAIHVKVRDY